jgi:hypothetical protein
MNSYKNKYKLNGFKNFKFFKKDPNFRTSYGYQDKVYFFFSEYDLSYSINSEIKVNEDTNFLKR